MRQPSTHWPCEQKPGVPTHMVVQWVPKGVLQFVEDSAGSQTWQVALWL